MAFLTVFMWLCLALFAAAAVIWLLDMVGVLTIRTDAQRTMLNASLGTTLLGGMASFAVGAFFTPPGDAAVPPEPAVTPSAPPPATPTMPLDGPAAPDNPATPPAPVPPQPAVCKPAAHPAILAEWAAAALGTPPTFRCAIAAPYPGCVAEMRELPLAEIARDTALTCGAELRAFRQLHIASAYAAKRGYQDNLDAAEASLRSPRNVEETAQQSYVAREIERMNGTLWKDFTALDQRSRNDMLACQSDVQRCLINQPATPQLPVGE